MPPRSQKTTHYASKSASHLLLEGQIGRIAARQLRLITGTQLSSAGLSPSGIRSRAARGRLFRLHPGVYATHPPPYSLQQRWLAAVLACGPGSLLSDWPAAGHWGIAPPGSPLAAHVTVPSGRGRSRAGITVHQRPVDPRDVRRKDGIPLTSVDLVLVHLSPAVETPELERMLVAAESLKLLNRRRLAELLEERRGRPGTNRLLPLLAQRPALTRSDLELLMLPIVRAATVARPLLNHPIPVPGRSAPLVVDLAWPELRLVVELDSQRWHGDWDRSEADRDRDQLLALAGWLCHRFFRRQVVEDPAGATQRLRRLVELRAEELGGRP